MIDLVFCFDVFPSLPRPVHRPWVDIEPRKVTTRNINSNPMTYLETIPRRRNLDGERVLLPRLHSLETSWFWPAPMRSAQDAVRN